VSLSALAAPGVATVTVAGLIAGETVHVVASQYGEGAGPCFTGAVDLCLDINPPFYYAGPGTADGGGVATVDVFIPDHLDGRELCFEALAMRGAESVKGTVVCAVVNEPVDPDECACPDGYDPVVDDSQCEMRGESVPAIFVGEPHDVCAIEPYFAYGKFGARYPDGLNIRDTYWGQDDGVPNGRMNNVGVWGCSADGVGAGSEPVGEWVGFQMCLDLADEGSYLVGMGADNRFSLVVDGIELLRADDGLAIAFDYWWMTPLELSAGGHVVEIWGYNDGSLAGFGTEISGPFDAGARVDDDALAALDYDGNLVWSTRETIGGAFEIGAAGWSCPGDDEILSLCEPEPDCTEVTYTPCL
jgi:hypothetical protein